MAEGGLTINACVCRHNRCANGSTLLLQHIALGMQAPSPLRA
jgi:hypothetical protein